MIGYKHDESILHAAHDNISGAWLAEAHTEHLDKASSSDELGKIF